MTNRFFAILRAAIWGGDIDGRGEWDGVIAELKRHGLIGVAADVLVGKCSLTENQEDEILRLMGRLVQWHYDLEEVIVRIFPLLEDNGVRPVLLKGQGLSRLYPMENTRACGDVDVFVGLSDFQKAMCLLGANADECHVQEDKMHGDVEIGDVHVEVHYRVTNGAITGMADDMNQWLETQFLCNSQRMDFQGSSILVPSLETNAIYVFEHLLRHLRNGGVGIRQFVDWLMVLKALNGKSIDIDERLLRPWQVLGGILVYQLGLPVSLFPRWDEGLARKSQGEVLRYIMNSGNFGWDNRVNSDDFPLIPAFRRRFIAVRYFYHFYNVHSILFSDVSRLEYLRYLAKNIYKLPQLW